MYLVCLTFTPSGVCDNVPTVTGGGIVIDVHIVSGLDAADDVVSIANCHPDFAGHIISVA
mgnify:CR=1 FL=1